VFEIGQDFKSDLTYEPDAVLALQTAAEEYIVETFEARDLFASYAILCDACTVPNRAQHCAFTRASGSRR
jgi:hypothetical protein